MSGLLPDPPPEVDWRQRLERKIDAQAAAIEAVKVALLGDLGHPGGALRRIDVLEGQVAELRAEAAGSRTRRLTWWHGAGLAAVGGLLSQVFTALAQFWHAGGAK